METVAAFIDSARELELPFIFLERYQPQPAALDLVPFREARRLKVFPLFQEGDRLAVAFANGKDLRARDYLRALTGLKVAPVLAQAEALETALQKHYVAEGRSGAELAQQAASNLKAAGQVHDTEAGLGSPVARLLEQLVAQAVQLRASDLHLEMNQETPRLRYRIDGVLHDFKAPPQLVYEALVSRVKILSELDIAERRRPQDGRLTMEIDGRPLELRVSIIPGLDAEGLVIRVLGGQRGRKSLQCLGFSPEMLESYRRLIRSPYGLVLVTGPTGAGKTTTLYSTLEEIRSPKRKIITLENPVEARVDGIFQIPVTPQFSFSDGLRAILRHDPDVVLIGEVRDLETAEIAIRASLTGHLIFSTMHTNSAVQALHRLLDIGIPFYKLKTSILGVLSQRLVRKLCQHCRRPVESDEALLKTWGLTADSTLYESVGCEQCQGLGYHDRLPVYEFLEFKKHLPDLNEERLLDADLSTLLEDSGFISLEKRARDLLALGQTSTEEVAGLGIQDFEGAYL